MTTEPPPNVQKELQSLQARLTAKDEQIAILTQERDAAKALAAELERRWSEANVLAFRFKRLAESDLIGIAISNLNGMFEWLNPAMLNLLGFSEEDAQKGIPWLDRTPEEDLPLDMAASAEIFATGRATPYRKRFRRKDGSLVAVMLGLLLLSHPFGDRAIAEVVAERGGLEQFIGSLTPDERAGVKIIGFAVNMSAVAKQEEELIHAREEALRSRDQAERARQEAERAQEEIIRAQARALADLSTPLLSIAKQVLVMPLIGAIDSTRAQQVLATLLHGVEGSGARVTIIDVTGVPLIDSGVADALTQAAHACRLLGAQTILTGIRPEVAQTLVQLNLRLESIHTATSLEEGIRLAFQLQQLGAEVGRNSSNGSNGSLAH